MQRAANHHRHHRGERSGPSDHHTARPLLRRRRAFWESVGEANASLPRSYPVQRREPHQQQEQQEQIYQERLSDGAPSEAAGDPLGRAKRHRVRRQQPQHSRHEERKVQRARNRSWRCGRGQGAQTPSAQAAARSGRRIKLRDIAELRVPRLQKLLKGKRAQLTEMLLQAFVKKLRRAFRIILGSTVRLHDHVVDAA